MNRSNRFVIMLFIPFVFIYSCGNGKNENDEETDSLNDAISRVMTELDKDYAKNDKSVFDYLKLIPAKSYGMVSFTSEKDFEIIDNQNHFIKYEKVDGDGMHERLLFKQLNEGRTIFSKISYHTYKNPQGYYAFVSSFYLLEYIDGEWFDYSDQLPDAWKSDRYVVELKPDADRFELYDIEFDPVKGEETSRKLKATAEWSNQKFVEIATNIDKPEPYKIIVAFNYTNDVTEDWNWFFSDLVREFEKKGVHVVDMNIKEQGKILKINEKDFNVELDLTKAISKLNDVNSGYLFIIEGQEPHFCSYNMSESTIKAANEFFEFDKH